MLLGEAMDTGKKVVVPFFIFSIHMRKQVKDSRILCLAIFWKTTDF